MTSEPQRSTTDCLVSPALDPLLLPPMRVGMPSSWWGHVPFAHWLVHELKPRLMVELGTQHGVSFSAFCNAVKHHGLATRCYAVDTWLGDEQAGFYDETVYGSIDNFVRENFSAFATLVRSEFDAALRLFADKSIDLLHIDGLHTYEAVRKDFETWRPKLSDDGVVLFHDTAIYAQGFGVWQYWDEIRHGHTSFEFRHSCGLGILAPGNNVPAFVRGLANADPSMATALRHRLAELGERWIVTDNLEREAVQVGLLRERERSLREENARYAEQNSRLIQVAEQATQELSASLEEAGQLRLQVAAATQDADGLRQQLERVRTSASWRVTGPYRVVARAVKQRVLLPLRDRQRLRDARVISRSGLFSPEFYLGREVTAADGDALSDYLAASRAAIPRAAPRDGLPERSAVPGFHPMAYAEQCQDFDEASGEDPLAHYLRVGAPDGPWKHAVIWPDVAASAGAASLRIVIHGHFHYPDLLPDFLARLDANASSVDLLITTTTEAKAADITTLLAGYGRGRTSVVVVPNRGRDIGPLLMLFQRFGDYDLLGHFHGKRSPQMLTSAAENWRDFLWTHLLGGAHPMLDIIAARFAAEPQLGLVFPEDPNLYQWGRNHVLGDQLAQRLGCVRPLPHHFDFPKGTMFWLRPAALRPLVDLGWVWDDFPEEPLASDGTLLHAVERIIPFASAQAGFRYDTTHVPGCWRWAA